MKTEELPWIRIHSFVREANEFHFNFFVCSNERGNYVDFILNVLFYVEFNIRIVSQPYTRTATQTQMLMIGFGNRLKETRNKRVIMR